ncbi:CPBP family intramembrane glutamic endopeptidase [Allomuricauda sp. R78024]|uniref:CPBP family intramembrane glutamic endopeptidase n=1 Tax=Allomuricauda sp. R78024 TaxID=3093867 RepID=UPI0037CBAB1C
MSKTKFWKQLLQFITVLLSVLFLREYMIGQLLKNGAVDYSTHMMLGFFSNIVLTLFSLYFIKNNKLGKLAGLKGTRTQKWFLLIFPLVYLVLLNIMVMDTIPTDNLLINCATLAVYVISIGFAEELSIRGFLQSHLIKHFGGTSKKARLAVFASALFFGLVHLVKFDKGIYGELSQVAFATFIGVMFGMLLLVTKRLYPIIAIHAIIDFVAKLDAMGMPINEKVTEAMSLTNAVFIMILVLPCLIYGIFLMKRYKI